MICKLQLSLRSLNPSFGLLFQDVLMDLDVDSTGTSIIMSVLDAVVNFTGKCDFIILNIESYVIIYLKY